MKTPMKDENAIDITSDFEKVNTKIAARAIEAAA
jgi:hypothetical protein